MMATDQETVAGYLSGERKAVGTVDGWISRAAWPYQRRLADRWEDVLQDVRLEVTRLLGTGKFRGESSLRTYLWRVVSHTCLDQIRAQSKWKWADLGQPGRRTSRPRRRPPSPRARRTRTCSCASSTACRRTAASCGG